MAVAGDILIKIAADLAQFTLGMNEAVDKLDKFGKAAKSSGDQMSSFIGSVKGVVGALALEELARHTLEYAEAVAEQAVAIKTQAESFGLSTDALQAYQLASVAAGQSTDTITTALGKFNVAIGSAQAGNKAHIDALNQLGLKILDVNGALRPQNDLLQEAATRLLALPAGASRAAIEIALFGRAGQQINPILQQLAKGVDELEKEFAKGIIPAETIQQLHELEERSKATQAQIAVIVATLYAPLKQTFLDGVVGLMKEIEALSFRVGDGLRAIGLIKTPRSLADDLQDVNNELDIANKRLKETTEIQQKASEQGVAPEAIKPFDEQAQRLAAQIKQLEDRKASLIAQGGFESTSTTIPPVVVKGERNPVPTGTGQSVEEAIKKLQDETKAADAAYATLLAGYNVPLDTLSKAATQQKAIGDLIAQLSKSKDAAGYKQQIDDVAHAVVIARDRFAELQKTEAEAAATDVKFGSGAVAFSTQMASLGRQLATNRINLDTYTKAAKEAAEAHELAALAAKRYSDDISSLSAGFEAAALQYSRANDLYAQGGQLFTGITTAMTDSLDVLSGKSNKTFMQIAADFATMLEQMAIKAAVSQVFKLLFATTTSTGGVDPSDWFATFGNTGLSAPRAAGGSVYPDQSYMVGENGPERFVPTVAGQIQPMSSSSGGGAVTINLDMGNGSSASPAQATDFARKMKQAVLDTIANEKRPGGSLYGVA